MASKVIGYVDIIPLSTKKLKNKFEKKIYKQLKKSGLPFGYETNSYSYILVRRYIPDFVISTPVGKLFVECKGYLRPEDRSKLVAVKKIHPEIDLRIVFYSKNKKYIRWAEKNGFKYAIGEIPEEWLIGL
jgi:hypothetical protein